MNMIKFLFFTNLSYTFTDFRKNWILGEWKNTQKGFTYEH